MIPTLCTYVYEACTNCIKVAEHRYKNVFSAVHLCHLAVVLYYLIFGVFLNYMYMYFLTSGWEYFIYYEMGPLSAKYFNSTSFSTSFTVYAMSSYRANTD